MGPTKANLIDGSAFDKKRGVDVAEHISTNEQHSVRSRELVDRLGDGEQGQSG